MITDAEIESVASLSGLQRASRQKELLNREKNRLQEEYKNEPEKIKVEYDKIKDDMVKRLKKIKVGAADIPTLNQITSMNIYSNNSLITEKDLLSTNLKNIEIRNPKKEVLTLLESNAFASATGILKNNLDLIHETLKESFMETEFKDLSNRFPINKYLGALNVSKADVRKEIYEYWGNIGKLFDEFVKDTIDFFDEVQKSNLSDEVKNKFSKFWNESDIDGLDYIIKFPSVIEDFLTHQQRYFNLIMNIRAAEKLIETVSSEDFDKDEMAEAENAMEEWMQKLELESRTSGDEWEQQMSVHQDIIDIVGEEWDVDFEEATKSEADPLFVYLFRKGDRLLSVTEQGEDTLREILTNAKESIEDEDFKISFDLEVNIEDWLEEIENSHVLDESVDFYLPAYVMDNKEFDEIYTQTTFTTYSNNKETPSAILNRIEDFFEELQKLLSNTITIPSKPQTVRGERRGTDMGTTFRGSKDTRLGEALPSRYIEVRGRSGGLRDEFNPSKMNDKLKGSLTKMMESANEYFFKPSYSGRVVVSSPDFASSIGSLIFQILSLDLGLETVMGAGYSKLARGSSKTIKTDDLRNIADFLENMYASTIRIDTTLITEAKQAARSLTKLMGNKDNNDNYMAALLYYFMNEINDKRFENKKFNGKSIKERAEEFEEDYKAGEVYPIFALPYFLSANQGLITQGDSAKKQEYKRIKSIYSRVQADLPLIMKMMLKAHDTARKQLGKEVVYGCLSFDEKGFDTIINKMYVEQNVDLSYLEVENIIKDEDSHENISKEYGISSDQVYIIKAHFR